MNPQRWQRVRTLFARAVALAAAVFLGMRLVTRLAPALIILLSLPVGLAGLVACAVFITALHSLRASMRPSNWSMQIGAQSLVINLRDYRNAIPGESVPVLDIPISEIGSAAEVTESWTRKQRKRDGRQGMVQRKYVDLVVRGQDTSELERVLRAERFRNSTEESEQRGPSRLRIHGLHVLVVNPGVVRMVFTKRLRAALAQVMPFAEPREVDLDEQLASEPALIAARALDMRGERIQAISWLSTEEGLSLSEAKELLDKAFEPAEE